MLIFCHSKITVNLEKYESLILPIKDKLYRFSLSITRDASESEDIMQEVFLRIWEQRSSLKNLDNPDAWCMRMVKNLAIDKLRAKSRQNVILDTKINPTDQHANPHQQIEIDDTIGHIETFIQNLPEKQRMVIQMRDIEGMTYKEIAFVLDIPMDQVKVNLHRARKQVRQQLIEKESFGIR